MSQPEQEQLRQDEPTTGAGGSTMDDGGTDELNSSTATLEGRLSRILRLEVPVIVKVAEKQLALGDVINLSPGSIIEFSRASDQPLQLLVNNKVIGSGAAVKVGEKFGLRINRIAPVSEKIRSLA